MKLATSDIDGVTVITLEGNVLGGPDATTLNDALHKLLEKRKKKVVVDLSDVEAMNSSGLGMLLNALQTMRNGGGDLKLASPSKKIESLLVITKLSKVFEVHASVKKAVGSFSA